MKQFWEIFYTRRFIIANTNPVIIERRCSVVLFQGRFILHETASPPRIRTSLALSLSFWMYVFFFKLYSFQVNVSLLVEFKQKFDPCSSNKPSAETVLPTQNHPIPLN